MEALKKSKAFLSARKKLLLFLLIIIVIVIIVVVNVQTPPVIETMKVKKAEIVESLSTTGAVDSVTSADLNFLITGKLVYLGVKKGDMVKKGQTIATLDQRTMQKNLELALKDYAKQRNTFEQTLDDNQDQPLEDDLQRVLDNNQHDLDKAVRSVELQTLAKEQSVLTSPIDGIITQADVTAPGVNVTTTTTFTVADPNQLVFKMDVDEADVGKVQLGQPVKITFDAYSDETINATVDAIDFSSHTTSTGSDVFTVESKLSSNGNVTYRIGMNGDAEIILREKNDVYTVSLGALLDDQYVFVKTKDGFVKKKVTTGIQSDTDVEITSGLTEGEEIATDPTKAEESMKSKKKFILF
jgi:RND family efflux transporter MFP subunit